MLGFTNKGQSNVDLIVTSIDGSFRYEGLRGHSRLSSSVFVYRVLIFVLQCFKYLHTNFDFTGILRISVTPFRM